MLRGNSRAERSRAGGVGQQPVSAPVALTSINAKGRLIEGSLLIIVKTGPHG
jgi:hypothetical protein